ncbi:MAG: 2'-5' RNA ligase family protein [Myroides sp.]|nr:2'-5' RNA ligase family protein [Myroides sp.]
MNKFSVVFMPDAQTIALIKEMKINLGSKCGSYKSKNALAHFTIFEFLEESNNEDKICNQLERIASEINPFTVQCTSFDYFSNNNSYTFYIKPSETSSVYMSNVMKEVLKDVTLVKKSHQTTTPHLTIGRQLSEKQLKSAKDLFKTIDLSFNMSHLTLRIYNNQIGQYEIYKTFPLLGKPKEIQGSLF